MGKFFASIINFIRGLLGLGSTPMPVPVVDPPVVVTPPVPTPVPPVVLQPFPEYFDLTSQFLTVDLGLYLKPTEAVYDTYFDQFSPAAGKIELTGRDLVIEWFHVYSIGRVYNIYTRDSVTGEEMNYAFGIRRTA